MGVLTLFVVFTTSKVFAESYWTADTFRGDDKELTYCYNYNGDQCMGSTSPYVSRSGINYLFRKLV